MVTDRYDKTTIVCQIWTSTTVEIIIIFAYMYLFLDHFDIPVEMKFTEAFIQDQSQNQVTVKRIYLSKNYNNMLRDISSVFILWLQILRWSTLSSIRSVDEVKGSQVLECI